MLFLPDFKQKFSKQIQNMEFNGNTSGRSRPFLYGRTDTTELSVVSRVVLRTRLKTVKLSKF